MGYADWTQMTIYNQSDVAITFGNAHLQWGKYYRSREGSLSAHSPEFHANI